MFHAKQCRSDPRQGSDQLLEHRWVRTKMFTIGGQASSDVVTKISMRIASGTDMNVLDAVFGKCVGQCSLGEPSLARQRQFANVHDALHAGLEEDRDEVVEGPSLVADSEELDGLVAARHEATLILSGSAVNPNVCGRATSGRSNAAVISNTPRTRVNPNGCHGERRVVSVARCPTVPLSPGRERNEAPRDSPTQEPGGGDTARPNTGDRS